MKAIIRSEYGCPEVLQLKEVPTPTPADSEVLVQVLASSVNMADVDYLLGRPKVARLGTGLRTQEQGSGVGPGGSGRNGRKQRDTLSTRR